MKKRSFILVAFLLVCSLFCLTACQGEQGVKGETGPKGDAGDKGPTGDKGQTGEAGKDGANYEFKVEGNSIYYAYETEEGEEKEWKPVISFDDLFGYKRTYTITLNADGGTLESTEVTGCVYKEDAFLEEPTKEGFTFLGWFDEAGNKVEDNILNVLRDYTLTAQWEAETTETPEEGA